MVKAPFLLIPAAWNDFLAIVARRWWIGLLVAFAVGALYFWAPQSGRPDWRQLAYDVGYFVLWIPIYVDTMRIGEPGYSLTAPRFGRLLLIGFGFMVCVAVFMVPGILLERALAIPWLLTAWRTALYLLLATKLGFVFFAAEHPEGAFAFSWRITSRAAFVPTLGLTVIATLLVRGLQWVVMPVAPRTHIVQAIETFAWLLVAIGTTAFINPWMIRWMHVAETMQPSVEAPAT